MTRHPVWLPVVLAVAATIHAHEALAEPIQITGGHLHLTGTSGVMSISGTRRFSLVGKVSGLEGVLAPWMTCHLTPSCVEGSTIDLQAYFVGLGLRSTVALDGVRYDDVGSLTSSDSADARFRGAVIAPPLSSDVARVAGQFAFEGRFVAGDRTEQIVGRGTATLTLRRRADPTSPAPVWDYVSADYDFTPTPEPATLVLLSTGLSGLAARSLRRRRD